MSFYIDTAPLVAAFTHEAATSRVQAWLAANAGRDVLTSEWTITEFASALSVKVRTRNLLPRERDDVQTRFDRMLRENIELLAIGTRHFRSGARLARRHETGLRAGDALHLAVCSEESATLCTLDARLAAAAIDLGIETVLI